MKNKKKNMFLPSLLKIQIIDKATYLEEQLVNAFNHTKLPELPDLEAINELQIKLIEGHWSNIYGNNI